MSYKSERGFRIVVPILPYYYIARGVGTNQSPRAATSGLLMFLDRHIHQGVQETQVLIASEEPDQLQDFFLIPVIILCSMTFIS